MDTWEGVKKKVRDEQGALERHLRELHVFRASAAERYDDDKPLIEEVEVDIKAKLDLIDGLCKKLNDLAIGQTARQAHVLRVKEMNLESRNELNRVSRAILDEVSKLKLFGKKRLSRYSEDDDSEANLLRERGALTTSLSIIDDTIENAKRARAMVENQTSRFMAATNRLEHIVAKIPIVNSLTSRIMSKSFRDITLLAAAISAGIFFIVWSKVL
jgi:hypothetical protein